MAVRRDRASRKGGGARGDTRTDMSGTSQKLDSGLSKAYRTWCEHPELSPDAGISILLTFEGDLASIEALGFDKHSGSGPPNQVLGVVHFKDIPALSAHPNVVWMSAGTRRHKDLDTAVRDIKARATVGITGNTADGVWMVPNDSTVITAIPKATGKGVFVAIIDTGIDFTHPMFLSALTPPRKTRIFRIWDQGLTPSAITECPDVSLLESTKTYGVQFSRDQINNHLSEATDPAHKEIAHKDCEGHGTHVAGIAAGGPLFPAHGNAKLMGVAPEAELLVVKFLDVPDTIHYRKPDGTEDPETVGQHAQFHDAILWCLRTAAAESKPVVINMSFGDHSLPGDGLDPDAIWIDQRMDPLHAGDKKCFFPKGAVIVKSAGNEGPGPELGRGKPLGPPTRRAARVRIPHVGETVLPLELVDNRMHVDTNTWTQCAHQFFSPSIGVHFWYRRAEFPLSVKFSVKTPHGAVFGIDVMVGGKLELGILPLVGPPPNDLLTTFGDTVHRFTIDHQNTPPAPHPDGGNVQRQYVHFFVDPKVSAGTVSYHTGVYEMRIKAPQDTEFFLICDKQSWDLEQAFFKVAEHTLEQPDKDLDPSEIKILDEFTSADPLGKHVITVSAYTDADGHTDDARFQHIANLSSRGPLRDYSDPASPKSVFPKPDICAPGVSIRSAAGKDMQPGLIPKGPWWDEGVRFWEADGTSMAAPMITGTVALMLEKNATMSTTDVRDHLSKAPRAGVFPGIQPDRDRAYGKGMVDVLTTHKDVP